MKGFVFQCIFGYLRKYSVMKNNVLLVTGIIRNDVEKMRRQIDKGGKMIEEELVVVLMKESGKKRGEGGGAGAGGSER